MTDLDEKTFFYSIIKIVIQKIIIWRISINKLLRKQTPSNVSPKSNFFPSNYIYGHFFLFLFNSK